ncbi:MAG: thymidine kinase [Cyclobacteriaceae bacterium]
MFLEPAHKSIGPEGGTGWIEVVCGSMFSGKTEELIRRLKRAYIAQQRVEIFKPMVDNRYSREKIVSHNDNEIHSTPVHFAKDIMTNAAQCDVIGIDEVQFFDESIVDVANELANQGKRVIAAGLDMDFMGQPFTPMDKLMAIAEYITKVHAICMRCGGVASYSHRHVESTKKVVLGEQDIYEALCRKCYYESTHMD